MNDSMKSALIILVVGALMCLGVVLNMVRAKADEGPSAEDRVRFWEAVKSANRVDGRTGVNCCSHYDAVRIRLIHFNDETGESTVEITDKLISKYGKVGDIVRVPRGHNTTNIFNPYGFPILFINGRGGSICLSGISGG